MQNFQEMKFINQDFRQKIAKFQRERGCFLTKQTLGNMNQLRMIQGRNRESSASPRGTETIVWNRCSYQVPTMVRTNDYTNENHRLYNSTVKAISIGWEDFNTKVGSLCACFVDIGSPVKTQVENGLSKIFDFRGQTIDVSDQAIFILNDSGIHDEEGNKTNVSDPLIEYQRRSGRFCLSWWRSTQTRLIKTSITVE